MKFSECVFLLMLQRAVLVPAAVCNVRFFKTIFPGEDIKPFYMIPATTSVPAEDGSFRNLVIKRETLPIFIKLFICHSQLII